MSNTSGGTYAKHIWRHPCQKYLPSIFRLCQNRMARPLYIKWGSVKNIQEVRTPYKILKI